MKKIAFRFSVLAALALTNTFGIAQAQTNTNITDGSVNNTQTTTTTTTTGTAGMAPVDTSLEATTTEAEGALPNTGGAPWLMALAGLSLAGGAAALRRKIA